MAEGGMLPWRVQRIDRCRGPTTSYSSIHRSLPKPPQGLEWVRNPQTKEWILVEADTKAEIQEDGGQNGQRDVKVDLACGTYMTHEVAATDTIQGICLKYGITATMLKKTNRFSGNNLVFAPSTLTIPVTDKNRSKIEKLKQQEARLGDQQPSLTAKQKMAALRSEATGLSVSEAKAYLELHDWDLNLATAAAKQDMAQEQRQQLREDKAPQEGSIESEEERTTVEITDNVELSDEGRCPRQSSSKVEIELATVAT